MKSGELANVRLWLGADILRESAELPLLTHSGHSVEHPREAGRVWSRLVQVYDARDVKADEMLMYSVS